VKVKVIKAGLSSYWYADRIGQEYDVVEIKLDNHSKLEYKVIGSELGGTKYFDKDDVEIIKEEKTMKKSDLKSGMRVLTHSQRLGIVLKDIGVLAWIGGGYTNLTSYREDLKYLGPSEMYSGMDIHIVFEGFTQDSDVLNFNETGVLLWDRREKTPEQIQLDIVIEKIAELQTQASELQNLVNK
jgi:hypothetical protein